MAKIKPDTTKACKQAQSQNKQQNKKALKQAPKQGKKSKAFLHDIFFKEIYTKPKHCLDLFRLVFTPQEMALFDWNTLKSEVTTFIDQDSKEKRTDLLLSAKLKKASNETVGMLFLVEHKSSQAPNIHQQLLEYQTSIYKKTKLPIIPIVIYHGRQKQWNKPLAFQDSLTGFEGSLKQAFGKNVLNFSYRLLNISKLNVRDKKIEDLLSRPVLFILQNIWKLEYSTIRDLFKLSKVISIGKRRQLIDKVADYIVRYDPNFSWTVVRKIEAKTITDKEERVMAPLQYSLDEATAKGIKKGMLQARQKYLQEGMQVGELKGRLEERRQVIANMFRKNVDIPFIAEVTGLSEKELKKLQKQHSKKQ